MKKEFGLITSLVLCAVFTHAQGISNLNRASLGIRAGVNLQNINGKDAGGNNLDNSLLTGFHVGLNATIPIVPGFYSQPGLLYSLKGAKSKQVIAGTTINSTTKIYYAELPLNFLYKPMLGAGRLLLGFGPYIAIGTSGKVSYNGAGISRTEKIKFKNKVQLTDARDVVYVKPIDAGANLLAGYEFNNKVSFQLNAQLGLVKINPEYEGVASSKASYKNTGFGFSLGYRF
jgi:hypothetical protein